MKPSKPQSEKRTLKGLLLQMRLDADFESRIAAEEDIINREAELAALIKHAVAYFKNNKSAGYYSATERDFIAIAEAKLKSLNITL